MNLIKRAVHITLMALLFLLAGLFLAPWGPFVLWKLTNGYVAIVWGLWLLFCYAFLIAE